MASKSSFLPRLPFARPESPLLPFHTKPGGRHDGSSARRQHSTAASEYDLTDLSPRPYNDEEDDDDDGAAAYRRRRRYSDNPNAVLSAYRDDAEDDVLTLGPDPPSRAAAAAAVADSAVASAAANALAGRDNNHNNAALGRGRRPYADVDTDAAAAAPPSTVGSSTGGSPSKSRTRLAAKQHRLLFSGPPAPIATSMMLYRDEQQPPSQRSAFSKRRESGASRAGATTTTVHGGGGGKSVLFAPPTSVVAGSDRSRVGGSAAANSGSVYGPQQPLSSPRGAAGAPAPASATKKLPHDAALEAAWRVLARRERALRDEVQALLDAQAAGLVAGSGGGAGSSVGSTSAGFSEVGGLRGRRDSGSGSRTPTVLRAGRTDTEIGSGRGVEIEEQQPPREDSDLTGTFYTSRSAVTIRGSISGSAAGSRHGSRSPAMTGSRVLAGSNASRSDNLDQGMVRRTSLSPHVASPLRESTTATTAFRVSSPFPPLHPQSPYTSSPAPPPPVLMPVRQPPPAKPLGLRGARAGLSRAMASLAGLKRDEDAALAEAVALRRDALLTARKLQRRKQAIEDTLRRALAEDEEQVAEAEEREEARAANAKGKEPAFDDYADLPLSSPRAGGQQRRRSSVAAPSSSSDGGFHDLTLGSPSIPDGAATDEATQLAALTRHLRSLERTVAQLDRDAAGLEARLGAVRARRAAADRAAREVRNRRDAGLSGYRGALAQVAAEERQVLARPPVGVVERAVWHSMRENAGGGGGGGQRMRAEGALEDVPLEGSSPTAADADNDDDDDDDVAAAAETFHLLRPERRTLAMAAELWAREVAVLTQRRTAVAAERDALEQGRLLWRDAVAAVAAFEAELRRQVKAGGNPVATGGGDNASGNVEKSPPTTTPTMTPQEAMMTQQLDGMDAVAGQLAEKLGTAEANGWNLLICAIGAELEAFAMGADLLRGALRASSHHDAVEDARDPLGVGVAAETAATTGGRAVDDGKSGPLLDMGPPEDHRVADNDDDESDANEVPPDLLAVHDEVEPPPMRNGGGSAHHHRVSSSSTLKGSRHFLREDSEENEVPPEFLAESAREDEID